MAGKHTTLLVAHVLFSFQTLVIRGNEVEVNEAMRGCRAVPEVRETTWRQEELLRFIFGPGFLTRKNWQVYWATTRSDRGLWKLSIPKLNRIGSIRKIGKKEYFFPTRRTKAMRNRVIGTFFLNDVLATARSPGQKCYGGGYVWYRPDSCRVIEIKFRCSESTQSSITEYVPYWTTESGRMQQENWGVLEHAVDCQHRKDAFRPHLMRAPQELRRVLRLTCKGFAISWQDDPPPTEVGAPRLDRDGRVEIAWRKVQFRAGIRIHHRLIIKPSGVSTRRPSWPTESDMLNMVFGIAEEHDGGKVIHAETVVPKGQQFRRTPTAREFRAVRGWHRDQEKRWIRLDEQGSLVCERERAVHEAFFDLGQGAPAVSSLKNPHVFMAAVFGLGQMKCDRLGNIFWKQKDRVIRLGRYVERQSKPDPLAGNGTRRWLGEYVLLIIQERLYKDVFLKHVGQSPEKIKVRPADRKCKTSVHSQDSQAFEGKDGVHVIDHVNMNLPPVFRWTLPSGGQTMTWISNRALFKDRRKEFVALGDGVHVVHTLVFKEVLGRQVVVYTREFVDVDLEMDVGALASGVLQNGL